MSDTGSARLRDQLNAAPRVLQAYVGFALVAGALSLSLFYAQSFYEKLLPYTGWMGLFFYLMTLGPARAAIAAPKKQQLLVLAASVGFMVLFGGMDTYLHTHGPSLRGPDDSNLYLAYHPYRPLVTMLIPAIWLLLILSLLARRWTKDR